MNKTDISREKIIQVSIELLKKNSRGLNMRNVAAECNVAVGSIYNYFPAKSDLLIAVVSEVWKKVFQTSLDQQGDMIRFTEFVKTVYRHAFVCQQEYGDFYRFHPELIGESGKVQGKEAMRNRMDYITREMEERLSEDPLIPEDIWTSSFTRQALAGFVFTNMLSLLRKGEPDCLFFVSVLERLLYP